MKNKLSYWERRQVQNTYENFHKAQEVADQISKLYLKASRYLSIQSDEVFEKYQTKHGLSEVEARQLINNLQDKTSTDELLEKLRNSDSGEDKKILLAKLEAPAYQARLERMQMLQNQIDFIMQDIYLQEKDFSTSFYIDLASEAYYKSVFEIQKQANVAFSFNHINAKQIDDVINSKWSGKNYSKRIWGNTRTLAQNTKEELLINLVTGRTNREAAEIIADKFGQGAMQARRLVWTESAYVSGELNAEAYQECGVEKYRFLATLDLRTSKVCRILDGKVFFLKDRKVGVNYNPMHPWCRSTTTAYISDELLAKMKRWARDPVTGKGMEVPADMTYEQWYDKYVSGNPKVEIEQKRIKNQHSDRKQHEKYREILGDKIPKSFVKFQDLKYNDSEKWDEIKAEKQDRLNQMDFTDMNGLIGRLGNKEVRLWYKSKMNEISGKLDNTQPLEQQARQAHFMRNDVRTNARELMADQEARVMLDRDKPNISFDELVRNKERSYGLKGDAAYKDIIRSSRISNKQYDKKAGLEE